MAQGWRSFVCEECGMEWDQATRDCTSWSCEDCPCCQEAVQPSGGREDLTLKVDKSGNLLINYASIVK